MIYEHITNFAGKPVKDWEAQSGISLGVEVDANEREEPDVYGDEVWRYVAVGE